MKQEDKKNDATNSSTLSFYYDGQEVMLTPHAHDVLSGRGAYVNDYSGNRHFRTLCWSKKSQFYNGSHSTKRKLASDVVESVTTQLNPSARFLQKVVIPSPYSQDELDKIIGWVQIDKEKAIHKACQIMRDMNRPDRINGGLDLDKEETNTNTIDATIFKTPIISSYREPLLLVSPSQKKRRTRPAVVVPVGETALSSMDNLFLNPSYSPPITCSTSTMAAVFPTITSPSTTTAFRDRNFQILSSSLINRSNKTTSKSSSHTTTTTTTTTTDNNTNNTKPSTEDLMRSSTTKGETIVQGITLHDHDVLFGRGAYVNAHPGNRLLRSLALERKVAFEGGDHNLKRKLAVEIIRKLQCLQPPARFLASPLSDNVKGNTVKCNAEIVSNCQTWVHVGEEKALQKATQVMRDLKRPDRISPGWTRGQQDNTNDRQMLRFIASKTTTIDALHMLTDDKDEQNIAASHISTTCSKDNILVESAEERENTMISSTNSAAVICPYSDSTANSYVILQIESIDENYSDGENITAI